MLLAINNLLGYLQLNFQASYQNNEAMLQRTVPTECSQWDRNLPILLVHQEPFPSSTPQPSNLLQHKSYIQENRMKKMTETQKYKEKAKMGSQ